MMQVQKAANVVQALQTMLAAAAISSADASKLTALVQSSDDSEDNARLRDDEEQLGAPAAKVYEGHSGGIVDTLQGLLDKAEAQLDTATKKETNARHNFEMLKQSLTDEMKFANKDTATKKETNARH